MGSVEYQRDGERIYSKMLKKNPQERISFLWMRVGVYTFIYYLTVWDGNPSRVACLFEVVLRVFLNYTTSLQLVTALSNCTAQIGGSDRSVFLSAPETFGVSNACHAHSRTSDLARLFSTNVSVRTAHSNIKALLSFPMGISLFISNRVCTSFMNHYYYVGDSL
jgi:hypothetical protein